MEICIIGSGVSGLMVATEVANLDFVKKITIIESKKYPPIKVGESTTFPFHEFIKKNFDIGEFVRESDASVKYGVYYENWSKKNFIHTFNSPETFIRNNITEKNYCKLLSNKDGEIHLHDLLSNKLWNFSQKNEVSLDNKEYPHSWHFDAMKLKMFIVKKLKNNEKIQFIQDTILDIKFRFEDEIEFVVGENGKKYFSDYFVNCCGNNFVNENVFKEKYESFSKYLLTNKAWVYPLHFTDKKKQFHPYTVSKAMKNGWRWITPTQSRIGTGYVFSDSHVSVDEARNEFITDIGNKDINPFLVNFDPRINIKPYKINNSCIGLSAGFLEPLDAPGLAFTHMGIDFLIIILNEIEKNIDNNSLSTKYKLLKICEINNQNYYRQYEWWCNFILLQYKTCLREDTKFWIDHKNVKCNFYDNIINTLENVHDKIFKKYEYQMIFKTISGKDIKWNSGVKEKPFLIEEIDTKTIHHLEYIQSFYK